MVNIDNLLVKEKGVQCSSDGCSSPAELKVLKDEVHCPGHAIEVIETALNHTKRSLQHSYSAVNVPYVDPQGIVTKSPLAIALDIYILESKLQGLNEAASAISERYHL